MAEADGRDDLLREALGLYQAYVAKWAEGKGFWKFPVEFIGGGVTVTKLVPVEHSLVRSTKLMLMVSELGECLESLRQSDRQNEIEELADCLIRILDYAGTYNLPLAEAVIKKMAVNEGRPYMHGKKF